MQSGESVRTAIALLLGMWLAGTLLVGGVAAQNFFMVDRLLQSPAHETFQKEAAALPPGEARTLLRYLSSELNRYYFRVWGWLELSLGAVIVGLAMRGLRQQKKFLIGFSIMLLTVAVTTFYITPRIIEVGRALDFVPREPQPPGLREFGILHAAYSALDLLKLLVGIWMAAALVRPERRT